MSNSNKSSNKRQHQEHCDCAGKLDQMGNIIIFHCNRKRLCNQYPEDACIKYEPFRNGKTIVRMKRVINGEMQVSLHFDKEKICDV